MSKVFLTYLTYTSGWYLLKHNNTNDIYLFIISDEEIHVFVSILESFILLLPFFFEDVTAKCPDGIGMAGSGH